VRRVAREARGARVVHHVTSRDVERVALASRDRRHTRRSAQLGRRARSPGLYHGDDAHRGAGAARGRRGGGAGVARGTTCAPRDIKRRCVFAGVRSHALKSESLGAQVKSVGGILLRYSSSSTTFLFTS
jgi:hypothetical protein